MYSVIRFLLSVFSFFSVCAFSLDAAFLLVRSGSVPVVRLIVPGDAVPVVRSLFIPLRRVLRSISAA